MGIVRCHISVSLDGYAAGPNQGTEHPLGEGGDQLHEWAYNLDRWLQAHGKEGGETNASSAVMDEAIADVGAGVMGRNMFGGGPGPWPEDPSWDGWWGENPPFHVPVFVTDGVESAVAQARDAAGDKDVTVAGGADTINQTLRAGLLDELELHVTPVILGGGERLLADVAGVRFEVVRAVEAPGVTHIKYRVVK